MALLYVMFHCVFVSFQYGVLGQVWYLIVSIPDLSSLSKSLALLETITQLTGVGVESEHNPYNKPAPRGWPQHISQNEQLASQVDYNTSHRDTIIHLKVDYDMIPKRVVITHLIGDTPHHILGNDWSYTC